MGIFTDLFAKHPEVEGVKEALFSIEQKYVALEQENKKLREELLSLKAPQEKKEFIAAAGVLWKNKPTGGLESVPYCPTCTSRLADYSGSLLCLKCNWQAPLKSFEVPKVFHELFEEK
jgi:hypothetical protein